MRKIILANACQKLSKDGSRPKTTKQIEDIGQQLNEAINNAIRGMQFGDINGQHIQYTQDIIKFVIEKLETLNPDNLTDFIQSLNEYQQGLAAKGKMTTTRFLPRQWRPAT